MDDKTLIQKVKDGDLSAVRILVDNHKNLIWHIIISMCGRHHDNEDLFQEVFLRVFKGIRSFRADAKLSTWIGTITHHVCVDHLRKKKREFEIHDFEADTRLLQSMASDWKKNDSGDINRLLLAAVSRLPADYRTVITLYHLDEHPYRDIAEITGMPEGTVKSYISRGRNLLREMLTAVIPDLAEILNE
jgi:RNA polymerase sigma factor (sigma-70 family)